MPKLGIHKRWNQKFLLKEIAYRVPDHAGLTPERLTDSIAFHLKHEQEIDAYADGLADDGLMYGITSLRNVALKRMRESEYAIYSKDENKRTALAQGFRHLLLDLLIRFGYGVIIHAPPNSWACSPQILAEVLASAYSFGWIRSADRLASWAISQIPAGALWSTEDWNPRWEKRREPFARFTLALYADFAGITLPELPPHPYESPAYDAMLACWRNPDPQTLVEPLLNVCDWHTHECMYSRSDKPSKNVDFINDTLMGWPVEVHTIYRLRERLGLALPAELNHPLMQAPLGPYLAPQPVPHDDRLERVVRRAYAEVPGLEEVLAGAL